MQVVIVKMVKKMMMVPLIVVQNWQTTREKLVEGDELAAASVAETSSVLTVWPVLFSS